ncbi:hypothetical protein PoB_007027900 [Plakobranchus ocellatus]|uniref:Uncharacterized protein n=1 Tax=Plakobranchus ocellatus TaxID=259542 RepID=A0AAV4DHR0_9GAST|nr:hypothetical protein PoB_007027900 [Plakobranchus ocellatus]
MKRYDLTEDEYQSAVRIIVINKTYRNRWVEVRDQANLQRPAPFIVDSATYDKLDFLGGRGLVPSSSNVLSTYKSLYGQVLLLGADQLVTINYTVHLRFLFHL